MSDEQVAVTGTPPASGDAAPAVQPGEQPQPTAEAPADAGQPAAAPQPKKVDPRQRKIAELAYQLRETQRQNDRLLGLVERNTGRPTPQADVQPPRLEDFRSLDEFLDARDQYRDRVREHKEPKRGNGADADPNQQRYAEAVKAATEDLRTVGSEKYEDFDEVVFDDSVKITPVMRDAIFELDEPETQTEVAYYLGKNPKEALRISRLSPMRQVAEIGKLEVKLTSQPAPQKRASAAPAPISPVGGASTQSDEIQQTEDFESFLKKRNKQLGRK